MDWNHSMSFNPPKMRQPTGKFQGQGIEHKIVQTHIGALNGALAAGMDPGMAHAMGDMAVRDMMAGQQDEDPAQKNGGGRNRKVGMVMFGVPK
jgi:hypothetical protein